MSHQNDNTEKLLSQLLKARFSYNAGSSRPYRCAFCDRCYKANGSIIHDFWTRNTNFLVENFLSELVLNVFDPFQYLDCLDTHFRGFHVKQMVMMYGAKAQNRPQKESQPDEQPAVDKPSAHPVRISVIVKNGKLPL